MTADHDPTPAEIEAGADALDPDTEMRPIAEATAERVLRAVLPDHDARVRADERAKVARAIASELAEEYNRMVSDGLAVAATPYGNAAAIARNHATPPEETDHGR